MLAEVYSPEHDPLQSLTKGNCAAISVYAQNRDYHDIVKKRLKRVGRWLLEQAPEHEIKVFVDTAPVMEKPLGQAAGLAAAMTLFKEAQFSGALSIIDPEVDVYDTVNKEHAKDVAPLQVVPAGYSA